MECLRYCYSSTLWAVWCNPSLFFCSVFLRINWNEVKRRKRVQIRDSATDFSFFLWTKPCLSFTFFCSSKWRERLELKLFWDELSNFCVQSRKDVEMNQLHVFLCRSSSNRSILGLTTRRCVQMYLSCGRGFQRMMSPIGSRSFCMKENEIREEEKIVRAHLTLRRFHFRNKIQIAISSSTFVQNHFIHWILLSTWHPQMEENMIL